MTSFKKLDHRQSTMTLQERSKMLAAKPKFGIGQNRVGKENSTCSRVGVSCFKVYTESDTAKADAEIRSYATVNKVSAVENTAALKAGLKSMEKQKGILGSSAANANVGRRALADVSNVKSNSSRIVGVDKKVVPSAQGSRFTQGLGEVNVG